MERALSCYPALSLNSFLINFKLLGFGNWFAVSTEIPSVVTNIVQNNDPLHGLISWIFCNLCIIILCIQIRLTSSASKGLKLFHINNYCSISLILLKIKIGEKCTLFVLNLLLSGQITYMINRSGSTTCSTTGGPQ